MTTDREQGIACLTNLGLSTAEAEAFFDQFEQKPERDDHHWTYDWNAGTAKCVKCGTDTMLEPQEARP